MDQKTDQACAKPASATPRKLENREWWLWGFAVTVTLVLTCGILSLSFLEPQLRGEAVYAQNLKEWVRGLAALVLLFDIYTVYQHLQLQSIRRELAERERLFHLITENAADMIAVVDRDGKRLYNSPSYERILGYSAEELAATSSLEQVHPDDRTRVLDAAQKAHLNGGGERLEYRIHHKDGSWRVFESTASAIHDLQGETEGLVIVNRDITERKQAEALLEHRAFHDGLTNLPNRALFLDRVQRAIAVSRRHPDFQFAVLFIDIDHFQVFNDSLGHAAGDELLVQIARRLTVCLRSVDTVSRGRSRPESIFIDDNTVARPGGDEFLVLAAELHDASDAIRMSKRIQERLAVPFDVKGSEIVITASIGVVFYGTSSTNAEDVLRDAEIAMYRAKQGGKDSFELFDGAMHSAAVKRLQLETDLRKALDADEFRVHYQPVISLQRNQIVGFEALSRWQRPNALILPGQFIEVATEIGLILPINRLLLRQACLQLRRWQSTFPADPTLSVSVNVTAKEFAQPDLVLQVEQILQQTGVKPQCVEFEITETIAMTHVERSIRVLSDLKALGVRLSIDDFGTGFSSLCRLQHLPVDTLKIDRSFISGSARNAETPEIVRIIIMLAHNLGLRVIAEGVENRQQLDMVQQFGCDMVQGFLFSRPIDADGVEHLLGRSLDSQFNFISEQQDTKAFAANKGD